MGQFNRLSHLLFSAAMIAIATPAHAGFDRPLPWEDMKPVELTPIFRSQYASNGNLLEPMLQESLLSEILSDQEQRINPQFKVPVGMESATGFWLKVYGLYTTQHVLIYDETHPELIYEVLDFRELAKTARNLMVYEIVSEQRVRKALDSYRRALKRLAHNKNPRNPSREEKSVLAAVSKLGHKHSFSELAQNVRAQTGQRDNVIRGILASDLFFPKMESLFAHMGIPPELTRLSLVESSFNLRAVSYAGATGVWQFMLKSGHEFLTINPTTGIDERLSPLKSTVAAAKLLKRNYSILGSWPLAISAYNHGHGPFRKISDHDKHFDRLAQVFSGCSKARRKTKLGYASRNYYPEFLAMLHAETYKDRLYGKAPPSSVRPIAFHQNSSTQSALSLVMSYGISLHDFKQYNPDVRNLHKPLPKGFWFAIPGNNDDFAGLVKPQRRRAGGAT